MLCIGLHVDANYLKDLSIEPVVAETRIGVFMANDITGDTKFGRRRDKVQVPRDWLRYLKLVALAQYRQQKPGTKLTDAQIWSELESTSSRFPPSISTYSRSKRPDGTFEVDLKSLSHWAEIINRHWLPERLEEALWSLTTKPAASMKSRVQGLEIFLNRADLDKQTDLLGISDVLEDCTQFDIIGLSAAVAVGIFLPLFERALERNDFRARLVILDPSPENAIHYDALVSDALGEQPSVKRGQALGLRRLLKDQERIGRTNLEAKVIRGLPLHHCLWLAKDRDAADYIGHLSVYMYSERHSGPCIRVTTPQNPLLAQMRKEFEHVWKDVAVAPEWSWAETSTE